MGVNSRVEAAVKLALEQKLTSQVTGALEPHYPTG